MKGHCQWSNSTLPLPEGHTPLTLRILGPLILFPNVRPSPPQRQGTGTSKAKPFGEGRAQILDPRAPVVASFGTTRGGAMFRVQSTVRRYNWSTFGGGGLVVMDLEHVRSLGSLLQCPTAWCRRFVESLGRHPPIFARPNTGRSPSEVRVSRSHPAQRHPSREPPAAPWMAALAAMVSSCSCCDVSSSA